MLLPLASPTNGLESFIHNPTKISSLLRPIKGSPPPYPLDVLYSYLKMLDGESGAVASDRMNPHPYAGCQPPPGQLFQPQSLITVEPAGSFGQVWAQASGATAIANSSKNMTRFIEILPSMCVVLPLCRTVGCDRPDFRSGSVLPN